MILYFLQHCPPLVIMAKTYPDNYRDAGTFALYFNTLAGIVQVLIQGRQLSIRDTFAYCQTIALSQYQIKKEAHA
jgi:hypothetical protein